MNFRDVAIKMVPNGWHSIIPLTIETGQKKPAVKWAQYRHDDVPVEMYRRWCGAGWHGRFGRMPLTGLVFGALRKVVALDIDLTDTDEIAFVKKNLLEAEIMSDFVRIGSPPKFMLFFKGDARSSKHGGIEVFGSSGQVAIFGTHPNTKRSYDWPLETLLDVTPDDLPCISQEQIDHWLRLCSRVLRGHGGHSASGGTGFIPPQVKETLRKDGVDGAHRLVLSLKDGERHPVLLGVTGWLVSRGYTAEEIAEFVNANFPDHLRRQDWKNVKSRVGEMASNAIDKWFGKEDW